MMSVFYCSHEDCGEELPGSVDVCPACGRQAPPPNIRVAESQEEVKALNRRVEIAEKEAGVRGALGKLNEFAELVANSSRACINAPVSKIQSMFSSSKELYNTFYSQVESGGRIAEDNAYDPKRLIADTLLFPNYHKQIVFSALSLNGIGPSGYGPHTIVLKESAIAHRATAFETNSFNFCDTHGLGMSKPIPKGYRAKWEERAKIAKAKLAPFIAEDTLPEDFPKILLKNSFAGTADDEFIEVHIYGSFNSGAIEKVTLGKASTKADKALLSSIKKKLTKAGVECSNS